jgi:hypothetical protein
MAVKTLFGWGGVMISTTDFPTAFGTVAFVPEYIRNTTIAGKHIQHFKGWRAVIECELFNDGTDTYSAKWETLVGVLSAAQFLNIAFGVYPRYTSTDTGSTWGINCFLDSDFAPVDWANTNVGQSVKLKFISENLLADLPTNLSSQEEGFVISEDGSTDDYLMTEDGSTDDYLMQQNGV